MKLITPTGMPDYIEAQLRYDDGRHGDGTLSATQIMKPIRVIVLVERHGADIEYPLENFVESKLGEAWHTAVTTAVKERYPDRFIVEREFSHTFDVDGVKVEVKGTPDLIRLPTVDEPQCQLIDLKSTKTYGVQKGDARDKWATQLSIYRVLLAMQPKPYYCDDYGEVTALFKDWSESWAERSKDYPQANEVTYSDIPLMPVEMGHEYIVGRLRAILRGRETQDDELPMCTPEEMWFNAKKGQFNHCRKWCAAREFCGQYRRVLTGGLTMDYNGQWRS